jgi:hypothetical protein
VCYHRSHSLGFSTSSHQANHAHRSLWWEY